VHKRRFGDKFGKGIMEGRLGSVFDLELNTATWGGLIEAGMRCKGERGHGLGLSCFAFHEGTYISRS
jgi:hypothetical protein